MIDVSLLLIDLHRHLKGSIRLETILDLGRRYGIPLPAWEVENLRPYVPVMDKQSGVMAFIVKILNRQSVSWWIKMPAGESRSKVWKMLSMREWIIWDCGSVLVL